MQTSFPALLTILVMALVTYVTRVSGLWLMRHVGPPSPTRMQAGLGYLPSTVIVAIVASTVFSTGLAEAGASLATVLVRARTRNVLLTMIVGISVIWGLRLLQADLR